MNFEQESNQYLSDLVTAGTIIAGNLIGVSEIHNNSRAICSFIVGDAVKEKHIILYKVDGNFTWKFLTPSDTNEMNRVEGDWSYPNYAMRIVAPISLIMDDTGIKMYGWFQINNLPVVTVGEDDTALVYLYCSSILPAHQSIVDSFAGIVTIENRP